MSKRVGILGYGEIGSSLAKVYSNHSDSTILIKDLNRDDGLESLDVLNICIPFKDHEQFSTAVLKQIEHSKPKVTIIHSTVVPGTTNIISDVSEANVVHSPVRGVHPNLYEGLMTFVKFVGSDDSEATQLAKEHIESLGIRVELCSSSRATELGKLLSTTYYGVAIAWHAEMKRVCDHFHVSFDEAVTEFNKTYNEGYEKLGKENVIRPVLFPPEGAIGGHCVIPNAKLLDKLFFSEAIKLVLKYEDS